MDLQAFFSIFNSPVRIDYNVLQDNNASKLHVTIGLLFWDKKLNVYFFRFGEQQSLVGI